MKGDYTTKVFTEQGKINYGSIIKSCGCVLGTKCNHQDEEEEIIQRPEDKKADSTDSNDKDETQEREG